MLRNMTPTSESSSSAREEWGRRYGWTLFALLGGALVAFAAWALSEDRPALAGAPFATGVGFVVVAAYLFVKRTRG